MKHKKSWASAVAGAFALALSSATGAVVTFETVSLPPAGFWNGSELSGTPVESGGVTTFSQNYQIGGVGFRNNYTSDYGSWSGFAISNHTDTTTGGFMNQYSAITGSGVGGSANYAVGYYTTYETSTNIVFSGLTDLSGLGASFTNTTYTALDMVNGGAFGSKKFGGVSGNDADWLRLSIAGYAGGIPTGSSVDFYLADFRFADNSLDYIVSDWRFVDFTPLGSVDELRISMSSSDNGPFGMNTPSYFAMDHFLAVPEPSALLIALSGLGLAARRRR
jgi:hypothetical protein